jgi:hypothetical protein
MSLIYWLFLLLLLVILWCPWYLLRPSYGIKGEEEKICLFQYTSPEIFYFTQETCPYLRISVCTSTIIVNNIYVKILVTVFQHKCKCIASNNNKNNQ